MAHELERLTDFLYEVGLLKRYKRTGWLVATSAKALADQTLRTGSLDWLSKALNEST